MGVVIDVIKEQVLAAVGGELAAHKDEVDELQQKLTILEERYEATATAVEERERDLAAVKVELGGGEGEGAGSSEGGAG
ncbi:unnamed protein product [Closterium sp. Naga37s-1]|nr:unnamed protein product [Closterium sp. Naga37s-1]